MTKEQTTWEEEFELLKLNDTWYCGGNQDNVEILREETKQFISKTISQEKEKWELETKKYRQITNLITSIFYYGNFKAETPNERELEKLLVDLNLWPTNEQIIIKRTDLLQNK